MYLLIKEKNIKKVNSSFFFLVGTSKDENLHLWCRIGKRWNEILVIRAASACTAAWENSTFHVGETVQNTSFDRSLQSLSNDQPAYWWV